MTHVHPSTLGGRESSGGEGEGGRKGEMGYEGEILMLAYEHKSSYILVTHIKPALEE